MVEPPPNKNATQDVWKDIFDELAIHKLIKDLEAAQDDCDVQAFGIPTAQRTREIKMRLAGVQHRISELVKRLP